MSTALVILPVIWATESVERAANSKRKSVERVSERQAAPEMAFYRKYTEAMLRRYVKMSMAAGRVPSLFGKEMFRAKVTSYQVHGFDDMVIFVHDVERCLERLNGVEQYLIRRIAMQEFTQGETAELSGMSLRSVHRRYADALDQLTEIFLKRKLLEPRMASVEAGSSL